MTAPGRMSIAVPDGRGRDPGNPLQPALRAVSLYRFFRAGEEETLALRGVSLRVEAGEFVAVVGPSGSGKSTLLSLLAGLDEPDGGRCPECVAATAPELGSGGERGRLERERGSWA